ncbi:MULTISPECIES: hypothetical protein [unclassified Streptomyces]|uniref:hypothetical protein n=1 Tax=unclassified Streptomyces TaxID=2593676 RepID=UPI0036B8D717
MGYDLHAVIGGEEALRRAARAVPAARSVSIAQGLSLMPMTDALLAALESADRERELGFWRLPQGFAKELGGWSAAGPVAYVEAEYFGGAGEQRAAVWDGGALVFGPLGVDEGEPSPPAGTPISQALRRLGVVAGAGEDEFSAAGLHRHRSDEAWIG